LTGKSLFVRIKRISWSFCWVLWFAG
jgi:hypothetical protein